ncbi:MULTISPECIES: hypothetical protein [unclassified Amycolatopsis]|uniref:hypothetical protein n=1 Tax=unclassified Amycolatopsis TaxID=2618356 RepID=UPI002874A7CA|nr:MULTISPECIES: hypothetical protein [unclassified Amycolatopsis]MDS0138414.1 hypothetical protein [Amycolatopsis sp. 505]MDS0146309.1 hypothetical protein [Amycolatopsis sp. CM201R]
MDEIGKFFAENPMAAVIAAGEIGFWVFIAAGLAVRYVLRLRRASAVVLAMVPLVDVVVLVATVLDLSAGGKPGFTHGLAAVYLGFSVVFGPSMVRWADERFAHRFAGGPPPPKRQGRERARHEWREWGKCLLACGLAAAALLAAIFAIGEPERVAPLWGWLPRLGTVSTIWLFAGPVWEELFGKREEVRS